MQFKDIIERKRDGKKNSVDELSTIVEGTVSGKINDGQLAAWLMAVYFKGLSRNEVAALTRLMWKSGETLPRAHREDYWIDKHSTGGVGDKTSLLLVPLVHCVARRLFGAGKVRIPMISGRGLGHTGGTLDKLESVRGFRTQLSVEEALGLLERSGYFMMGQTERVAPADRRIYAMRDLTATVESIPLIVSSIMSKKLSENLDGLVIDLKVGDGAFMGEIDRARELAEGLISVAKSSALDGVAILTNMDSPLGNRAGHLLEVEECWDFVSGKPRDPGLEEVTLALAAHMLRLASRQKLKWEEARGECEVELRSGRVAESFRQMFQQQGGVWESFETDCRRLREELRIVEVKAPKSGYLAKLSARAVGKLIQHLGGGRDRPGAPLDTNVGVEVVTPVGSKVEKNQVLMRVFQRTSQPADLIEQSLSEMIGIEEKAVKVGPRVMEMVQ